MYSHSDWESYTDFLRINRKSKFLFPKETLGSLRDTHFHESTSVDEDQEVGAVHVKFYNKKTNKFVEYIDAQEVCFALPSFGPMKAAGPHGLKPLTLQRLTDKLLAYLTNLFRICANAGNAPKVWRVMKVVILPKAGKKDYGLAKSYRQITLSNFLLKGLERFIQWYTEVSCYKESQYNGKSQHKEVFRDVRIFIAQKIPIQGSFPFGCFTIVKFFFNFYLLLSKKCSIYLAITKIID